MAVNRFAALWGLAEATVFFIVPDVLLSYAGRNKLRSGLNACLYSLYGALVGGVIMYVWGLNYPDEAGDFLRVIPGINQAMIHQVIEQFNQQGLVAVLFGPLSGIPYKIYATQAAAEGLGFWWFMLISIPARLTRFIIVTLFFHYALKLVNLKISRKYNLLIISISWISFYILYFSLIGI